MGNTQGFAAGKAAAKERQYCQIQQRSHPCQPRQANFRESVQPRHPRQPQRHQEDTGQRISLLTEEPEGPDQQQRQGCEIQYPEDSNDPSAPTQQSSAGSISTLE